MYNKMLEENIFAYLAVSAAIKYLVMLRSYSRRPDNAELVGTISEINIYPVKSCRGLSIDEVCCTASGICYADSMLDRHFMVADDSGKFVSQRRFPQMALLIPVIIKDELHLEGPGMNTLKLPLSLHGERQMCDVWGRNIYGIDCGDEAAAWVSSFLQTSVRMFYTNPDTQTLNMSAAGNTRWHKATREHDKTGFQDFSPIMLASDSSLGELNHKLDNAVDMRRFRPNFTVTGSTPFDEDNWCEVFIGSSTRFTVVKPCTRCNLVTVNPDTGKKDADKQPFTMLQQFRVNIEIDKKSPCFGVHLLLDLAGNVKVGDDVYAIRGPKWWQKYTK